MAGGTSRSYGIQVARIAGLPHKVIERAREILDNLERGEGDEVGSVRIARDGSVKDKQETLQLSLLGAGAASQKMDPESGHFFHESPGGFDRDQQNEGVPKPPVIMTTHWIQILLILTLLIFTRHEALGQSSSGAKALLEKADRCADTLSQAKDKKKLRHKWVECVDAYRDVASRYPQSEEAGWALYKGAKLQENLFGYSGKPQDLDGAIELYRRVANEHPNHRIADDAQYRIGEICYYEKNDITQAYLEFLKVEKRFPKGDMRPKAQQMLEKLSLMISKKESQKEIKEANAKTPGLTRSRASGTGQPPTTPAWSLIWRGPFSSSTTFSLRTGN